MLDRDLIWQGIEQRLPALVDAIRSALDRTPKPPQSNLVDKS